MVEIGVEYDGDCEVIVGFCESCGCPVNREEVIRHRFVRGKMVIDECIYC